MRPIMITMNAFGPYAGKAVVDMNKLGGKGLFKLFGKFIEEKGEKDDDSQ